MKERIRQTVLALGADVCGFAGIERFRESPGGFSPLDLYPNCKSAVVFGVALPKGLLQVKPRLIYGHYNTFSTAETDRIAFSAAKALERDCGCTAVPLPCDSPYESWDPERLHGRGLLSMKHAAVLAGLGSLGKHSLLLHPRYGTLLTVGALLTDLDLPSDSLCGDLCLPGCSKCVEHCPVGAIRNGTVDQTLCRPHTYGKTARGFATVDCNLCRAVCPMKYGKPQPV